MRHGWKSNYIVRKVGGNQINLDGNWTKLDGILTNYRKQQFFIFHILPMKHASSDSLILACLQAIGICQI